MQTFPQTILSIRVKSKYFFQYSRWYSQWGQVGLDSNSVTSKIWDGSWLDSLTQQHRLSEIKQPWIPAFPGNAAPHGQTPHGIQSALFSITKWANVWPCRGADCPRPSQWKHVGLENTFHIFSRFQHNTVERNSLLDRSTSETRSGLISDSSSPRPAIWLETGWVRFTFYDNKQSHSR